MTARNRPMWQTGPCPVWCDYAGDHDNLDEYEDREHISRIHELPLSVDSFLRIKFRGGWRVHDGPNVASVLLKQHYREVDARVWVGKCDSNQGMNFTLDEAEQLAETLHALVKEARST